MVLQDFTPSSGVFLPVVDLPTGLLPSRTVETFGQIAAMSDIALSARFSSPTEAQPSDRIYVGNIEYRMKPTASNCQLASSWEKQGVQFHGQISALTDANLRSHFPNALDAYPGDLLWADNRLYRMLKGAENAQDITSWAETSNLTGGYGKTPINPRIPISATPEPGTPAYELSDVSISAGGFLSILLRGNGTWFYQFRLNGKWLDIETTVLSSGGLENRTYSTAGADGFRLWSPASPSPITDPNTAKLLYEWFDASIDEPDPTNQPDFTTGDLTLAYYAEADSDSNGVYYPALSPNGNFTFPALTANRRILLATDWAARAAITPAPTWTTQGSDVFEPATNIWPKNGTDFVWAIADPDNNRWLIRAATGLESTTTETDDTGIDRAAGNPILLQRLNQLTSDGATYALPTVKDGQWFSIIVPPGQTATVGTNLHSSSDHIVTYWSDGAAWYSNDPPDQIAGGTFVSFRDARTDIVERTWSNQQLENAIALSTTESGAIKPFNNSFDAYGNGANQVSVVYNNTDRKLYRARRTGIPQGTAPHTDDGSNWLELIQQYSFDRTTWTFHTETTINPNTSGEHIGRFSKGLYVLSATNYFWLVMVSDIAGGWRRVEAKSYRTTADQDVSTEGDLLAHIEAYGPADNPQASVWSVWFVTPIGYRWETRERDSGDRFFNGEIIWHQDVQGGVLADNAPLGVTGVDHLLHVTGFARAPSGDEIHPGFFDGGNRIGIYRARTGSLNVRTTWPVSSYSFHLRYTKMPNP